MQLTDLLPESLWAEAQADILPFHREAERMTAAADAPATEDDFIRRRYYRRKEAGEQLSKKERKARISISSPWLQIGASEEILGLVNGYRGRETKLFYVDNWYTVPYPGAEGRIASQQWHRDPEEDHVVKGFLYLSDVDEDAGPFEYVKGSTAGGRYGDLWPWGEATEKPQADVLEQTVAPEDRIVATGPKGTLILCDTGGLHRGGFARTHARLMAVWTYISPAAKKGNRHRFRVDFEGREDDLSPQARFALD